MEAFRVFATLSLVDLISGPLGRIRQTLDSVSGAAAGLGQRFGNLAIGMAPLALGAGAVLGAFGKCVATAAGFEDQMAKVGAVSRASASELQELTARARELGASTQFTASQVGEAEQYLAMAGFSVRENIEALPGVLNLAAATATDLGRAADISSDIMSAFGIKAAQMGHVADVLTATCNSANTNMEMLGDTMKYVGPVARTAGLSLEETATMAGILANSGIKASQGGTVLRSMLNRLAAPTGEAAKTLQKLGVATQDASGNLKKPIAILKEMAAGMKGMGNAAQMAALKTVFGEEAMAGVSVLLQNANGDWNKLFDTLSNVDGVAEKTAKAMNDTLAGDMRGLGSAFESVQITIGNIFIPVARKGAQALTALLRWFDKLAQSPVGKFFLQVAATLASAIVAVTAFSAAMWGLSALGGLASKVFLPLKAAIMGVSAPMLAIIAIVGLLYAAFKTNFGGLADYVTQFGNKATIAVKGVIAVFQNLKNGTSEIKGELATEIKANGLVGFVQTVSRIVGRVMALFDGFKKGLASTFASVEDALFPARLAIAEMMQSFAGLFGAFGGDEVSRVGAGWKSFGEILGKIAGGVLTGLAAGFSALVTAISWLAKGAGYVIDGASALCGWLLQLTGATRSASDAADPTSWSNLGKVLGVLLASIVGVKTATLAWRGVMMAISAVTKAWTAAQWLLNTALRANPIGIVITLVMGLAAAAGWIISNWDTVKKWWNSFWESAGQLCSDAWEAVKGAVSGAIGAVLGYLSNLGASIVSSLAEAWESAKAAIVGVWDSITGGISEFGANVLAALTGAWTGLGETASALWNDLVSGAANTWNSIVSGVTGFGANLLAGITGAWQSVLGFFDGLNLFESGAKLLSTFVDGVKSMVGSVVDSVTGVLSKIRNLLPFSDAKEGPLSTLTLSGNRMMTTIAEGVNQGKGALTASVSGALGEAGKQIAGFEASVNPPEMAALENPAGTTALATPQPASGGIVDSLVQGAKDLGSSLLGSLGEAGSMFSGFLGKLGIPGFGDAQKAAPEIPAMHIPQIEAPAISIPEAPTVAPEDTTSERGHQEGKPQESKNQGNVTITIHNLNLPDVTDASGFANGLRQALQSEIGALEGA